MKRCSLFFFLLVCCFPVFSFSQSRIGPVIVTAEKRETLPEDVGAFVSVISKREMENQAAVSVPDLLRKVSGIDIVSIGTSGDDQDIRIRGADRDEVLVMIDGVSINSIGEHRALYLGSIPLNNVERIEIVRGSQSVFYGSDAVGGVVNIITQRGEKENRRFIKLEAGNLGTFRETLQASGSADKMEYSAAVSRQDRRGRFDRDRNGEVSFFGNWGFDFSPEFNLKAGTNYIHSKQELFYEFLSRIDGGTGSLLVRVDPDQNRSLTRNIGMAYLKSQAHPREDWEMAAQYSFFIDHALAFNAAAGDSVPAGFTAGTQDFDGTGKRHVADLRNFFTLFQSAPFAADFMLGFEFEFEKYNYTDSPTVFPDTGQKGTRRNYAPYFQQRFLLFDEKLILSGGARYDDNTTFGTEWSPRASILFKLKKTKTVFKGSYGEGFHAPTILEFFTAVLQRNLGLPFQAANLREELSQSYELGIEQALGSWGKASAVYFYIDYDTLFDELQLISDAYSTGVELGLTAAPSKKWNFGGNYTLMKARNEADGVRLPNRPQHRFNAFVEMEPKAALQLRADINVVGDRLIPNTLTTASGDLNIIFIDSGGTPSGGTLAASMTQGGRKIAGYVKVDVAMNYELWKERWGFKDLKIFGKIENLLDDAYQEKFGFPAPGITFLAGSSAAF